MLTKILDTHRRPFTWATRKLDKPKQTKPNQAKFNKQIDWTSR